MRGPSFPLGSAPWINSSHAFAGCGGRLATDWYGVAAGIAGGAFAARAVGVADAAPGGHWAGSSPPQPTTSAPSARPRCVEFIRPMLRQCRAPPEDQPPPTGRDGGDQWA